MNRKNYQLGVLLALVALILVILGGMFWSSKTSSKTSNSLWGFGQDIDLSSPEYNNTGFVIQDPRRVYISQDLKVEENTNYFNEAVVGIYLKAKDSADTSRVDYILGNEVLSGLVVSSDGWVLVNALGQENILKNIIKNKDAYVAVSKKDKKTYEFEDLAQVPEQDLLFLKIKNSNNLPVKNLVNISSLRSGQSLLAYNFLGQISIDFLKSIESTGDIKFTDSFKNTISLNNLLSGDFKNAFLFDLNGDLVALIDNNLNIRPIHDFRPYVYSFLKNKKSASFSFGAYYVDLRGVAGKNLPSYGAWINNGNLSAISKGGLAESAGILENDVIVKINSYEIDNYSNLNDVLNNFISGEKITISVLRKGEVVDLKIDIK